MLYRRRAPQCLGRANSLSFWTWRLYGSLPPSRWFAGGALPSGEAFAAFDRLLDEARMGPLSIWSPAVADLVVEGLLYNACELGHYALHAFVVMPNHVHLLVTAAVPLPKLTKSVKGITARRANAVLGLTGEGFWQEESYDIVVGMRGSLRGSGVYRGRILCGRDWFGGRVNIGGGGRGVRPGGRPRTWGSAPLGIESQESDASVVEGVVGDLGVARGPGGPAPLGDEGQESDVSVVEGVVGDLGVARGPRGPPH